MYIIQIKSKRWHVVGVSGSLHTSSYLGTLLPSNVEEIAAQEKVGFSSSRHRDLNQGVVQSQTASVLEASFKNTQMSQSQDSSKIPWWLQFQMLLIQFFPFIKMFIFDVAWNPNKSKNFGVQLENVLLKIPPKKVKHCIFWKIRLERKKIIASVPFNIGGGYP